MWLLLTRTHSRRPGIYLNTRHTKSSNIYEQIEMAPKQNRLQMIWHLHHFQLFFFFFFSSHSLVWLILKVFFLYFRWFLQSKIWWAYQCLETCSMRGTGMILNCYLNFVRHSKSLEIGPSSAWKSLWCSNIVLMEHLYIKKKWTNKSINWMK